MAELREKFSRKQWKDCCGKGCKKCEIAQTYVGVYGKSKGLENLNEDRAVMRAKQTGSVLQVCLGVDPKRADLSAFREASRLILTSVCRPCCFAGLPGHRSQHDTITYRTIANSEAAS